MTDDHAAGQTMSPCSVFGVGRSSCGARVRGVALRLRRNREILRLRTGAAHGTGTCAEYSHPRQSPCLRRQRLLLHEGALRDRRDPTRRALRAGARPATRTVRARRWSFIVEGPKCPRAKIEQDARARRKPLPPGTWDDPLPERIRRRTRDRSSCAPAIAAAARAAALGRESADPGHARRGRRPATRAGS